MQDILKRDKAAQYSLHLANQAIDIITQAADELAKSGAAFDGGGLVKELMNFRNSVLAQHHACRAEVYTEFKNRQILNRQQE